MSEGKIFEPGHLETIARINRFFINLRWLDNILGLAVCRQISSFPVDDYPLRVYEEAALALEGEYIEEARAALDRGLITSGRFEELLLEAGLVDIFLEGETHEAGRS